MKNDAKIAARNVYASACMAEGAVRALNLPAAEDALEDMHDSLAALEMFDGDMHEVMLDVAGDADASVEWLREEQAKNVVVDIVK